MDLNSRRKLEDKIRKKKRNFSQFLIWQTTFLFLIGSLLITNSIKAAELSNERVIISDSRENASNVSYTYQWAGSTTTLKCFKILFCNTATGSCNLPGGLDTTVANKGSWSGLTTGNWILDKSTNGTLKLTNAAGEAPTSSVSLEFSGITNPGSKGTYFNRIETFSDVNCLNSVDGGIVSFTITGPGISISVTVPGLPPALPEYGGGIGPETKVIFEGRAYPSAFLTLLKNGRVAATFFAEESGLFKQELTGLKGERYTFGIWAEDTEGRKSTTLSFTIEILEGTITNISGIFLAPTIEIFPTQVERGKEVSISGQTFPESEVHIFISPGNIIKKTRASLKGDWEYKLATTDLEEGEYGVKAKAFFGDGEQSQFSQTLSFLVRRAIICWGADLNFDGEVNIIDFSILLYFWGQTDPENICADINFDGIVDIFDFSIMMYWWTG